MQGNKWNFFLRNSFFGAVTNPDTTPSTTINDTAIAIHPEFGAKVLTDMSFGYDVSENLTLTVGSSKNCSTINSKLRCNTLVYKVITTC